MKVLLNEFEDAALVGLPYAVICLYVRALRPRMNYVTGMVGVTPFISWQALTEWLYVEPRPGIKGGSPLRDAVRRAAWQLERAGLIKIVSNVCNKQLIFKLPLATLYKHAQNKAAINPPALPARPLQRENTPKAARGEKAKAAIHLSTAVPPTNDHYHHRGGTYTGLSWPTGLTAIESRDILSLLEKSNLNGTAQLVLDELEGRMLSKGVSNKVGYARTLIERAQRGEFTPEKAHLATQARAQRSAVERTVQAATHVPLTKEDFEKGKAIFEKAHNRSRKGAKLDA